MSADEPKPVTREAGIDILLHALNMPDAGRRWAEVAFDRLALHLIAPQSQITRDDDGSISVAGRRYAQWPNNSWRGTPAQAVEAYEADAEMVPACAYDAALADRNALIRLLAQLPAPQSPVVPGVDLSELQRWDEYDFGLAKNHWGPWVKFEDVSHLLATSGHPSREEIDHAYVTAYHKCKTEVLTTLERGGPVEFNNPHDAGIDAVYALIQGKEEA